MPSRVKEQARMPKTTPMSRLTPTSDANSQRVTTDVLLAIKPEHLANIMSQAKNHEYRKYRLRDEVVRLWFYETAEGRSGGGAITHIATIPHGIRHTPGSVPVEPEGIGNEEFNAGRKEAKYGYPILELYELVRPVTLREMRERWGMGGAPMGWRYLTQGLWEDRWGKGEKEEGRGGEVVRMF